MQKARNLIWAAVSYSLVLVGVFDPTKWITDISGGLTIDFTRTDVLILGSTFFLGFLTTAPLLLASGTLTHELGHSVAVGLTGGRVLSLKTVLDSSGITSWSGKPSRPTRALVAIAGPLACSLLLLASVRSIDNGIHPASLLVISALLLLIAVTTVRSLWGWINTLLVAGAAFGVYYLMQFPSVVPSELSKFDVPRVALLTALAVLSFNCGSSIRYSIRCRSAKRPEMDEAKFASALGLPGWLGGHLILAANLWLAAEAFRVVLA